MIIWTLFIPSEYEIDTYWTNLTDDIQSVINLYHVHNTNEQFHSELKNDLGVECLPSGKFNTRLLHLQLAIIAFNTLHILGRRAL